MNNVPWYFALVILATQLLNGAMGETDLLDTIFLRSYGATAKEYVDKPMDTAALLLARMEKNKPTVLHIHGFKESTESESVVTVASAFALRGDHNVLAADYRNISALRYPEVVMRAPSVGKALAMALNKMFADGLDPEKLHIVGHSLGAHVAKFTAEKLKSQIPRITGLDPAGPLFNFFEVHLTAKDARFVDIIHTDYGAFGISKPTGTVDFFPNGGHRIQPGCPKRPPSFSKDDFCSHHRSWKFYAESVINEKAFVAWKCRSESRFLKGGCKNNEKVLMGYATPNTTKGTFYLITGAESPFGLKDAVAVA